MGTFTIQHEYINDDTLSEEGKKFRKTLQESAKTKGAIGVAFKVAEGDRVPTLNGCDALRIVFFAD